MGTLGKKAYDTDRSMKSFLNSSQSKVRWHEEGERNTKYFYSLEKRHHDIKTVSKLKVGDNCYIEDQFDILEEEKKFYESLYRSTNINPENFKNSPFFMPENVTVYNIFF